MEAGSDTAMKSSSTSSKTVVEQSLSSVSSSSKMIKQSSLSSEKQLSMAVSGSGLARDAIESMAGIGASSLANKMALMQLGGGGDDANLTIADRPIMGSSGGVLSEIDVAAKQSSMSSATSSSSSLSTVSSVMKKSSATVVESSTSANHNGAASGVEPTLVLGTPSAAAPVTVEDSPAAGDGVAAAAAVALTIKKEEHPAAAAADENEDVVEEVIEIVEGDDDGEVVEVNETVNVVERTQPDADATTKTVTAAVTVVKKEPVAVAAESVTAGSGSSSTMSSGSSASSSTTTTTTTTTTKSVVEAKVDGAAAKPPVRRETIITTTPPTPTSEELKPVAVAAASASSSDDDFEEDDEEEEDEVAEDGNGEAKVAGGADSVPARKPSLTVAIPSKEEAPVSAPAPAPAPAPTPAPTLTAAPVSVVAPVAAAAMQPSQQKQEILSHTIKEIISDIDCNIKEEESIAQLKQQQQELLKKQQELAQQIRQQQLLAQQLTAENQLQQQQLQQQQSLQNQQQQQQQQQQPKQQQPPQVQPQWQQSQQVPVTPPWKPTLPTLPTLPSQTTQSLFQSQPPQNVSKYSTYEETKDENGYTRKTETYQSEESSNVSKRIDLNKIFTPATDAEEILPKNRKLYASSAFYSPSLHPTVEDQVELARRISHSLSDISNQKSKGQSMYVNRKKRSVKWVHEGSGQVKADGSSTELDYEAECKENDESLTTRSPLDKVPLRLLMNPRGQIRDFNSLRESLNTETGLLSPDRCAELVSALQTQKGRGAELFAKRRRKSDKWVVDETNAGSQSPSGLPDFHQYQPKPPTSPSILPAYSDAGKHRVQLNMHQEQVLEKYAKPGLKVVKTPWEAALETGSASSAFVEEHKSSPHHTPVPTLSPAPAPQYHDTNRGPSPYGGLPASVSVTDSSAGYASSPYDYSPQHQAQYQAPKQGPVNPQRELAYKPNLAQGWKAPSMALPKVYQQQQSIQQQSIQQQSIQQQSIQQQSIQQQSIQQQQQHQWQLEKKQCGMYQQFQETTEQKREEHQVHQEYIDRAAQRCEAFTSKNDDEIIGFIRPEEVGRTQMQLQLQPQAPHEFINHLIRSPELRVSPMPPKNLLLYDSAMQEFQRGEVWEKQHQQQLHQQQQLHLKEVQQKQNDLDDCERAAEREGQNTDADAEEQQQRVNVRKQLQQFEEYQQQVAMQRRQEELLFKQREERLIRKQQQQVTKQMQQHQQQQHTEQQQYQQQEQQYHQQQQQQHRQLQQELQRSSEFGEANNHEQDDYVKVAVRDLISTFEQQTITEAEKLPKEPQSQRNQSHQEAQAQAQLQQQQQQHEQQRDTDERMMREKMDRKMMMEFQEMQQQQQQQQYQRQQQQQEYKEQYLETQFQQQSHEQHFQTSNATQVYRAGVDEGRNKEELYVPKEIPLESYAPPPAAVNMKPTAAPWRSAGDSGANQYGSSYPLSAGKPAGSGGFPLSQANSGGFSAGPNYDAPPSTVTASMPPKQQYWAPSSYQRVPQKTSQTAPPVNFNPSPLPYDKLAKFEGGADSAPSGNNYGYQPQRHLTVQQQGSKVRNASPTPFGRSGMGSLASPVPRYSPAYDNASNNNYASSPISPSPRPPSQQYSVYSNEGGYTNGSTPSSRISAADLLHSQNFNTSARGWRGGAPGGGGISSYRQQPKQAPIATGNMPYTDF